MDFTSSRWRLLIAIVAVAFLNFSTFLGEAADGAPNKPSAETLDNAAVIELSKLGLGDNVILEKINSSACNFDTSLNGLKQLKTEKLSDGVITAMIAASKKGENSVSPAATPGNAESAREAGIYFCEETAGKTNFTKLEPSVYTQTKGGVAFFAAYGQTAKSRAVLHPAHAMLQCSTRKPCFYFYFENASSGLGATSFNATSPNEFILAKLEFKDKDNLRSLVVGQFNAYSGTQFGPEDKSVQAFDFDKVSPGVYKVSPRQDLQDGEYCFFYGGNAAAGVGMATAGRKVYDFGIRGSAAKH